MRMKRNIVLCLLLVVVSVLSCWPKAAGAALQQQSVTIPLFTKTQILRVDADTATTTFLISSHSPLTEPPLLSVEYSFSSMLNGDISGLTVQVDDMPIMTVPLAVEKHNGKNKGVLTLRLDRIEGKGTHKVQIIAVMTLKGQIRVVASEKQAENAWVTIEKSSHVTLTYGPNGRGNLDLTGFPQRVLSPIHPSIIFVYPDGHTREDDTFLAQVASYMGRTLRVKPDVVTVKSESEYEREGATGDVIFVGLLSHFKKRETPVLKAVATTPLKPGQSILAVQPAAGANQGIEWLIGAVDMQGVYSCNAFLSDAKFLQTLSGQSRIIQAGTVKDNIPEMTPLDSSVPFSRLGYTKNLLPQKKGTSQEILFSADLPAGTVLEEGSKAVINYTYNDSFSEKRSSLTAIVNNIPVKTIPLQRKEKSYATIEIPIPLSELRSTKLTFRLVFSFEDDTPQRVDELPRADGWAEVLTTSYYQFVYEGQDKNNFDHFPYPLLQNNRWNDLWVVLPDQAKSAEYQSAIRTILALAQEVKKTDLGLSLVREKEITPTDGKDHNILIHSEWTKSAWLAKYKRAFSMQEDRVKVGQWESEGMPLSFFSSYITFAEIVSSPENPEKFWVSASAFDNNRMPLAYKLFEIPKWQDTIEQQRIAGQTNISILLYNDSGMYAAIPPIKMKAIQESSGSLIEKIQKNSYLRLILQGLLFIATAALLLAIWGVYRKE